MSKTVRDVMTTNVITLPSSATVTDAARRMRDSHVGAIVIERDGRLAGLVTDRDVAVRAVADGRDPNTMPVFDIATRECVTLSPEEGTDRAVEVMRQHCVRRIPVLEKGRVVGILSLGDLAIERDRESVLGHISAAVPST
jgi:CBS domain-containing protein